MVTGKCPNFGQGVRTLGTLLYRLGICETILWGPDQLYSGRGAERGHEPVLLDPLNILGRVQVQCPPKNLPIVKLFSN